METDVTWIILIFGLLGLVVGSFLNVVIHRLPRMLQRQWSMECAEWLEQVEGGKGLTVSVGMSSGESSGGIYNLMLPRSHCPSCLTPIRWWHNIPLLGYLWLWGRCAACHCRIPIRYPLVELLAAVVAIIAGIEFGFSYAAFFACVLGWFLITIGCVDFEHRVIPDVLTLLLLWIGLLLSCFGLFSDSTDAILGATLGYIFLWVVSRVFWWIRKEEGMGLGDAKLLAAVGAWLGWQLLPLIILVSSFFGLLIGLFLLFSRRLTRHTPIPFAPFIAVAAWIALIWGFDLTQYYLSFFGNNWTNV